MSRGKYYVIARADGRVAKAYRDPARSNLVHCVRDCFAAKARARLAMTMNIMLNSDYENRHRHRLNRGFARSFD